MSGSTLDAAQGKSQWLALALSFFILSGILSMTLLSPPQSQASDPEPQAPPNVPSGNFQSPSHCRECHETEFEDWSGTSHSQAAFGPAFRVYVQLTETPGECFSCHTTGYNYLTGQFVLAGVTCEACHGPYREGHPNESMVVAASEELCGTCHTQTIAEWSTSRHGSVGVTCADCHEVHTQNTRSADNTNGLCASCHQAQTRDATHTAHSQIESGILCVDCHLASAHDDSEIIKQQTATGHSFQVLVKTCSDCHPAPLSSATPTTPPQS